MLNQTQVIIGRIELGTSQVRSGQDHVKLGW